MIPIRPKPQDGEILSSWVTRLALDNNFYLHEFYKTVLGIAEPVFTRDIDKLEIPSLSSRLMLETGIESCILQDTSLKSFEGTLFETLRSDGSGRWTLPLGIYHRTRRRRSVQYCPLCLAEDSIPYYRKLWRLSFVTICPIHNCVLLDCCPHCHAPIDYLRLGIGRREFEVPPRSIDRCSTCGETLWKCNPPPAYPFNDISLPYLSFMRSVYRGELSISGLSEPLSLSEYNGLRILVGRFVCPRAKEFRCRVKQEIGLSIKADGGGLGFDFWPLSDRLSAITLALWILEDWPSRFCRLAVGTKLSKSAFSDCFDDMPFWLSVVVESLLNKSEYVISDDEMTAAERIIVAKYGYLLLGRLAELLGMNETTCRERYLKLTRNQT